VIWLWGCRGGGPRRRRGKPLVEIPTAGNGVSQNIDAEGIARIHHRQNKRLMIGIEIASLLLLQRRLVRWVHVQREMRPMDHRLGHDWKGGVANVNIDEGG